MKSIRLTKHHPVFGAMLLFVVAQILTVSIAFRESSFLKANNISIPSQPPEAISVWPGTVTAPGGEVTQVPAYSSLGPIVIYFLAVTAGVSLVLALIPMSALKVALRVIFAFLFAWGAFVAFVFWVPMPGAIAIAAAIAVLWFRMPRVWFHDLAMVLALASLGAVFGHFITPWTAMIIIGALAVYDLLAVRFGLMLWLTGKLSKAGVLPALVIPKSPSEWRADVRQEAIDNLVDQAPAEREYSILGGGDIAFPCLLTVSVYFAYGLTESVIMAAFTLAGIIMAYVIQAVFLKGKAIPALPPIAVMAVIGLLVIR